MEAAGGDVAREGGVRFRSMDGTALRGTLRMPEQTRAGVLLVHGLTGDRNEAGGLYKSLAGRLDAIGAASLRFDVRGHGESGGKYEDVTLSSVINDMGCAYDTLVAGLPRGAPAFVVAASFAGGLAVCWSAAAGAAMAPAHAGKEGIARLAGLVLLCPVFDYAGRMLRGKPYWDRNRLTANGAAELFSGRGWLEHGEFRIGPAMLNEIAGLQVDPARRVADLGVPLLTIHGSVDSVAPYDMSHRCTWRADEPEFATIEGADHMFTDPDDDESCGHPATRRFRNAACGRAIDWMGDRV